MLTKPVLQVPAPNTNNHSGQFRLRVPLTNMKIAASQTFIVFLLTPLTLGQIKFRKQEPDPISIPESPKPQVQVSCLTNEEGPVKNKPCVFPFILNGRKYTKCTKDYDARKRPWCSTQVDEMGIHMPKRGQWGYCNNDCKDIVQQEEVGNSWFF